MDNLNKTEASEARLNGEILDQDILDAYNHHVQDLGEIPSIDDVVETMFFNNSEYEDYWNQTPKKAKYFWTSILNFFIGSDYAINFEESQKVLVNRLNEGTWHCPYKKDEAEVLLSLMKNPITANVAEKALWNIYGDDSLMNDLDEMIDHHPEKDARPIIKDAIKKLVKQAEESPEDFSDYDWKTKRSKPAIWSPEVLEILKKVANYKVGEEDTTMANLEESLVSLLDQKKEVPEEEQIRAGQETMIKQKLNVKDDIDLSDLDDDTIAALAGTNKESSDESSDELAEEASEALGLEDDEALKKLSGTDLSKIIGVIGNNMNESITSVSSLVEYYNMLHASNKELALGLKEHCGLKKEEAKEIIQNRFAEKAINLDKMAEYAQKLKEESIHTAFEDDIKPTAIPNASAGTETKEDTKPKDLNSQNPLEDIQGDKIKENWEPDTQIPEILGYALVDIRSAQRNNAEFNDRAVARDLRAAEQKVELAKGRASSKDV